MWRSPQPSGRLTLTAPVRAYLQPPFIINWGAYTLANISAEYEFKPGATVTLTAHNLFDENYSLTDGYPEPGGTVTVGMKMKF